GPVYQWDEKSSYIQEISFFDGFSLETPKDSLNNISNARMLVMCDDNTTTDHISPVSRIRPDSAPGQYLMSIGVDANDLTSLGARRDRKSTSLNSSHVKISYAVFCLKKKKKNNKRYNVQRQIN